MHKLAKGLKKKKKPKKGKKGVEEEEFDPEELERYRRERAEAQQKAAAAGAEVNGESGGSGGGDSAAGGSNAGTEEWRKFEALTAGVDSILKKTQGDLDRIKSTSFFQRKPPLEEKKPEKAEEEVKTSGKEKSSKKWIGFDEEGKPIEEESAKQEETGEKSLVGQDGFVDVPEDDEDHEESADEDIFDTTYVDVLQNIDIQLAYIPESPTQEELEDDPFDTTNADKVLKTVDKKGNKLVSLGNAVEVLAGRIDHVSTCKLTTEKGKRPRVQQDLLLTDFEGSVEKATNGNVESSEPVTVQKTLLDDDSDLPDVPVDLSSLPAIQNLPKPVTPVGDTEKSQVINGALDISEFEPLGKEKTILEEIPDLDDADFDLEEDADIQPSCVGETEDPFAEKNPEPSVDSLDFQAEIIEASFEAATFVNEADPFDTSFAENILPGKTELKFIEKELENLPISEVSISLTDPAGLDRNYETGLLQPPKESAPLKKDLLGGSTTDLTQLADQPIDPLEEITYVDPFDTSTIHEPPPGKTELKVLEEELLGEEAKKASNSLEDDDFDPRKDEDSVRLTDPVGVIQPSYNVEHEKDQVEEEPADVSAQRRRKPSRPEALPLESSLFVNKTVAFELPTPSKKPDLLTTSEEEKTLRSKPLTPYYSQKSIEETVPIEEKGEEEEVDPFDTSFVSKVAPGRTELKLIESELLSKQEPVITRNLSDDIDEDFNPRAGTVVPNNQTNSAAPESTFARQETLLDAEVDVDAKPLTPKVETKRVVSEEISYADPFDTSIATNILPGKAELKVLENELGSIVEPPPVPKKPDILLKATAVVSNVPVEVDDDFDPRADEEKQEQATDFLQLDGQDTGDKILTPFQDSKEFTIDENIDPFDTSFAVIGPGKTELKILESELMEN